ncbi:undecaprenyl-diphosphate phosphatase [Pokkaliibacter sp. MBI-7]|uniref:undecaprenyl-diphosphate phosphatase n=1 Tax=Pokkaliibacter sp. MBI-7 TaxID=3040600 RepID=UPI0024468162|nr:undecaprenyl-diphosphate phosphatase [Pokkaliibacter sp. MBI-7]MDH2434401.1 undecaprenyl-diphosphate phosphatase [Pokkaliibacter sp. MBI-7]
MDILQALVLGLVEGITEFLPISSTGHLIIASQWLGMDQNAENKAFEVIIQLAAILAVTANYADKFTFRHVELWKKVILAFIPVGAVGFLFSKQIKALFSPEIVAIMFIVGGIVFLIVERFYKEERATVTLAELPQGLLITYKEERATVTDVENLSYKQALWIGIAQVFALIPGTSRAGSTIIGAMLVGLSRKASAEFSFLLALPVMLAASGYDLLKHYHEFAGESFMPLIVGFIVAFISAYIAMRLFIRFLAHFTFVAFGIYRILFGALLLLVM